jgi:hypothetical protein
MLLLFLILPLWMVMRKYFSHQCALFFLISQSLWVSVKAQEEPQGRLGINPPSIHWYQISTPTGKIIFPEGADSLAKRAAGIMNYERIHDKSISGSGNTKHVSAILQNLSTLPGGFSTPAPWRNEYYLTPPQNLFLGPIPWFDGLTAHEYRHTQQFSTANSGFTLAYKVIMGETGWLLNSLFTQPLWFREGDAVVNETILTAGGRGRLPSFNMEYRALRLSGYHYSYEKAAFPSLQDFVPNPYRIGYYMVTKARRDYGDEIWTKVLEDSYHHKGFFWSTGRSLEEYTGKGPKDFYNATVKELDSIFQHTDRSLHLTTSLGVVNEEPKVYTSWRFPQYLPNGSLVSLKNSFREINTYYVIDSTGSTKKLFSPGVYTDDHITTVVEGNLMTWAESSFNERWFNKDYSIIKVYDFKTGRIKKLSSKSRYFSPAPSHNGDRVAIVNIDLAQKFSVIILDANTGDILRTLPNPENVGFSQLRWLEDDKHLVALTFTKEGNGIRIIDVESGEVTMMLNETTVPVSRPFAKGNYIYFSAGYTGIDNIYAIDVSTKKIAAVTSVRFGAYQPVVSADGSELTFSEYTADGYRLKKMVLDKNSWKPLAGNVSSDITFHAPLVKTEGKNLTAVHFDSIYPTKKYHALTDGLFNVYGWFPIPNIPEYGAEFYTQNIMSTLRGTVGILYNTNENNLHTYLRFTYAALYPVIDLQYEYGLNRKGKVINDLNEPTEIRWTENVVSGGITFPFRLTQGTHITRLSVSGLYEYYDVNALDTAGESSTQAHSFFYAFHPVVDFSRLRIQARQEVKPRWGQTFHASYEKAIGDEPERLFATAQIFFPGIIRTHSLNFSLNYKQEAVVNTYRFRDDFIMPRGYKPYPFERQYGIYANYEFPIWYPDISLSSVAFFQRLRMNVFYDYSIGKVNNIQSNLSSAGAELFADLRLFRLFQVSAGVRYSYPFTDGFEKTAPVQFLITRFELAN